MKTIRFKSEDYCPHCGRVTPHVKDDDEMLCKRCGKKEKKMNFRRFTDAL